MTVRRKRLTGFAIFVLVCLTGFVFSNAILMALGAVLVRSEAPQRADIVVVIGGDYKGNRIVKGAELVREGYAPEVIASGSAMYGSLESDLAIAYAVTRGYPRADFISLEFPVVSTTDEAKAVVARLRAMGVHKYLLVTSDFHTARAGRVFRRAAKDLEIHVVAAPDPDWNNGLWWKTREGRKTWLNESLKTLADRFGI